MSLDRRLREGLDRLAEQIEPDIEGRLTATLHRGRRPRILTFAMPVVASAAAIALVAIVAPALLGLLRGEIGPPVGATRAPSPSTPGPLGAYTRSVTPGDPAVDSHNLAGTWTIEFQANGSLSVMAPTGFTGTRTGYSYDANDGELVTDLFGSDVCSTLLPGTYRWQRVGNTIAFTATDDECLGRAALLAGQPWQSE